MSATSATTPPAQAPAAWPRRAIWAFMAVCLGIMAALVFINVVLRYGFGTGIAATEELSRLLFVWMVFAGALAAYPAGEHMAFTSLIALLRRWPGAMKTATVLIRLLVILACVLLAWGAWHQVVVGLGSHSVVLNYSTALLPLPALLCAIGIGVMAGMELVRGTPLALGHGVDVE